MYESTSSVAPAVMATTESRDERQHSSDPPWIPRTQTQGPLRLLNSVTESLGIFVLLRQGVVALQKISDHRSNFTLVRPNNYRRTQPSWAQIGGGLLASVGNRKRKQLLKGYANTNSGR